MNFRLVSCVVLGVASTALIPTAAVARSVLVPFPAHFPRPAHTVIISEHFKGRNDAYVLKVANKSAAFKYWKQHLPKKGWTVLRASSSSDYSYIDFRGHGYGGSTTSQGQVTNNTVIHTLDPRSRDVVVVFHKVK
jgi:hypothetical protein